MAYLSYDVLFVGPWPYFFVRRHTASEGSWGFDENSTENGFRWFDRWPYVGGTELE